MDAKGKGKVRPKPKQYNSTYQKERGRTAEERRPQIVELWCKGWTQRQIADHFGISPGRVCQEIGEMREEWRQEFLHAIDTMKAEEGRRILHLERTYWREFDKSCKKRIYPKKPDGTVDYEAPEDQVKVVEVLGDAELLAGIRGCMELRCKLFGLTTQDKAATQVNVFTVEQVATAVVEARKAEATDRLAEVERLMMDLGEDGIARLSQAAQTSPEATPETPPK